MRGAGGDTGGGEAASSTRAPLRLSSRFDRGAGLLLALLCTACGSTRWPSGRKYELAETPELIARRGKIALDQAAGELQMPWVGARVPPGLVRIESASFVVYEDANRDGEPQTAECLLARETNERVEKIMFHDLRVEARAGLQARLTLRIGDAPLRLDFPFRRD